MMRQMIVGLALAGALAAGAQDPLKVYPTNYWVEFENPWIQVIHVRYRPHETVGVHDHSADPTLYVYLSDSGPVIFEHAGKDDFDLKRAPLKEGQMRLSPGRKETHHVENLGDIQSDFLRVELRSLPLGLPNFEKRIPAADAAFWAEAKPEDVVWDDARLKVTRVGLHAGGTLPAAGEEGGRHLWLFVNGEGATVGGKPAHPGEGWDSAEAVKAGPARVELVRLDVK